MKIRVEAVTKKLSGRVVLKNVNYIFESGNIYGIVGKNGSGKTMLLRTIVGLIKPTEGKIYIDDQQLGSDIDFLPNVGLIIEKPQFLNYLTGLDNLKLLAEIKDIVNEEQIKEYMEMFSLESECKLPMKKYSLGMQQKIGIIQAIMENPDVLVLDEPFNALDEGSVNKVFELLFKYKEEGKLIILTSHHKDDIEKVCNKIVTMCDGEVVE